MKKKLISAVVKLGLALLAVTLITYWWFSDAWFAQNVKTPVDGVEISTVVPLFMYITIIDENNEEVLGALEDFDKINFSLIGDLGFSTQASSDTKVTLRPSSSDDGKTFWYALSINKDGEAVDTHSGKYKKVEEQSGTFRFYEEMDLYILSNTQSYDDVNELTAHVSFVNISGMSDNELYKAARISITVQDDEENSSTVIYRYDDQSDTNPGKADPATNAHDTVTDPSVAMGEYEKGDPGALSIALPSVQEDKATLRKVTIRMWFEGENEYAIRTYAGGGFKFDIGFYLEDPS